MNIRPAIAAARVARRNEPDLRPVPFPAVSLWLMASSSSLLGESPRPSTPACRRQVSALSFLFSYLFSYSLAHYFSRRPGGAVGAAGGRTGFWCNVRVKRGGACLPFHGRSSFPAAPSEPPTGVLASGSRTNSLPLRRLLL